MAALAATFLIPAVSLTLCGSIIVTLNALIKRDRVSKSTCTVIEITALLLSVMFLLSFSYTINLVLGNTALETTPLNRLNMTGFVGAVLIIFGALMPFVGKNEYYGVRTPWSMRDDVSWKSSQKFGAVVAVLSGIAIIVGNLYVGEFIVSMILMLILLTVCALLCCLRSYYVSRKSDRQSNEN
ncbi:MAG: SdpI family protein [Candidatus Methanoplasma sp.]|jgi:uncharacterized membrane protein|nr:SdpI family protein [Candidatus Methanoplasma sp.]